ncbi:MAG TPA: hypothetical protein VKA51_03890, partial [Rubrobacteraceae bacterium]|nr:hypothetical protein [Rubrobacteraceae bacterium]
ATVDLALEAKEAGEEKSILFNLCGHGHFDLAAYEAYLAGNLVDLEYSEKAIDGPSPASRVRGAAREGWEAAARNWRRP